MGPEFSMSSWGRGGEGGPPSRHTPASAPKELGMILTQSIVSAALGPAGCILAFGRKTSASASVNPEKNEC